MKKSELIFSAVLIPIDYLMVFLAGLAAYYLRFESALTDIRPVFYDMELKNFLVVLCITSLGFLFVFVISGLYNFKGTRKVVDELAKVFVACSTGILLIIVIIFFQRELFSSRFIIISGWGLTFFFVSFARILVRALQRSLFRKGIGVHNIIIIGHDKTTDDIIRQIHLQPNLGYCITARFDDFSDDSFEKARELAKDKRIDEVTQGDSNLSKEEIIKIIGFCNDYHLDYRYAAGLAETQKVHLEVNTIAGIPIIEVKKTPLDGWGKIIKRVTDTVLAALLLIVLSPILLLTAIAVKLDSRGPVFVRLERIGEQGKHFVLFKFRSMIENAHSLKKNLIAMNERKDGPLFKIKDDPRITRIGKFIRKTSLDELPQFFNVLKGEMSLVGPRPHEPEEVANYKKHHRKLLTIKPGVTGLAQVSGRSDLVFEEEVKLDIYYIENWSLRIDIQILLKTPFVVISTKSAQ